MTSTITIECRRDAIRHLHQLLALDLVGELIRVAGDPILRDLVQKAAGRLVELGADLEAFSEAPP